jgi:hypothetical protein
MNMLPKHVATCSRYSQSNALRPGFLPERKACTNFLYCRWGLLAFIACGVFNVMYLFCRWGLLAFIACGVFNVMYLYYTICKWRPVPVIPLVEKLQTIPSPFKMCSSCICSNLHLYTLQLANRHYTYNISEPAARERERETLHHASQQG